MAVKYTLFVGGDGMRSHRMKTLTSTARTNAIKRSKRQTPDHLGPPFFALLHDNNRGVELFPDLGKFLFFILTWQLNLLKRLARSVGCEQLRIAGVGNFGESLRNSLIANRWVFGAFVLVAHLMTAFFMSSAQAISAST